MPKYDNLTEEQIDEYARAYVNAARRASYARHPERVLRQRLTSAVNLLTRYGLIDDQQRQTMLARVGGAASA